MEKELVETEDVEVCEYCGGAGEVGIEDTVWAGEPHTAILDYEKCFNCTPKFED